MKGLLKFFLFCHLIQLYIFEICKIVDHNFYLIALKKNPDEYNGLNKYNYSLILESNPFSENDNYHLIFSITFPVNINIELSPDIIYKFFSLKKFCIRDLINKSQENIVGKLIEYNSGIQILKNVWIKIIDVNLYQEPNSDAQIIYYFFGKNIVKNNEKYLFLKKESTNSLKHYYQIVRLNLNLKDEFLDTLKIGTEFAVLYPTNEEFTLREGLTYQAFVLDDSAKRFFKFIDIESLVCLYYEGRDYKGKCFDNKSTNKKITYL